MFIGDKSLNGRKDILGAKGLLDSGLSEFEVFKKTGCFIGVDGKWRKEVDESELKFSNEFRLLSSGSHGDFTANSLFYKPIDEDLYEITVISHSHPDLGYHLSNINRETLEEHVPEDLLTKIDLREGRQSLDGSFFIDNVNYACHQEPAEYICLMDALESHDLLHEYHQFWNVFLRVDPELEGANMKALEPHERVHPACDYLITLGKGDKMRSLSHELQHVVQRLNGFPIGGNHRNFSPKNAHEQQIERYQQTLDNLYRANPEFGERAQDIKKDFLLLTSRYITEKGTCDWMSVPEAESKVYFEKMNSLKDDYPEETELERTIQTKLDMALRRGRYSELSPIDQYLNLAGEIEAYTVDSRYDRSQEYRRDNYPISPSDRERAMVVFGTDDVIDYELAYEEGGVSHYTHPKFKDFSTLFIRNTATPDEVLGYCAEMMLEIYSDLSKELPQDNDIVKDYNRIMAMLRIDPDRYELLTPSVKEVALKEYADGFKNYLAQGVAPKKLGAVFATLKKWVVGMFRGMTDSPISKDISNADLYERMFSKNIELSPESDFQMKLNSQIRKASEFTTDVVLSLSSLMDSMVESVSERSGLPREVIEDRYNIRVSPHVANKVKLTV